MRACVRVLDSLGLELETIVSCHVGMGFEPRSSGGSASAPNPWPSFQLENFLENQTK